MEEDIPTWDISPVFYYYSGVAAAFYNIFLMFSPQNRPNGDTKAHAIQ